MNRAALHVEEDGHTYTDPDNDTILDSYGRKYRRTLNYLVCNIHGMFRDMEILISLMPYMVIPTEIKTPSTVMVLGAYVKKRRDIY